MVEARGIAKGAALVTLEGLGILGPPRPQQRRCRAWGYMGSQPPMAIEDLRGVGAIARKPSRGAANGGECSGHSQKGAPEHLGAKGLPRLQQHLSDLSALKRARFGGSLSCPGHIGSQLSSIIGELGVIAAKPSRGST